MPRRDSHCSFCGAAFHLPDVEAQRWPRTCSGCASISYKNPIPVAVMLVPVDAGLLVIRRGIPPQKGMLALPGGFVDFGESWQAAGAREVFEETGLRITPEEIRVFDVKSATDGPLLVFGLAAHRAGTSLPPFQVTNETTERLVIDRPEPLAFPLHTEVVEAWFRTRG
jgi:ADP-ribose pyrophosphatase YjhB (NUDIX family)